MILVSIILVGGFIFFEVYQGSKENDFVEGFEVSTEQSIKEYEGLKTKENQLQWIKSWRYGDTGYAYLLDENFQFIYHPNPNLEGQSWTSLNIEALNNIKEEVLQGQDRILFKYTYDEREKISLIYKTKDNQYLVFHGNPDESF